MVVVLAVVALMVVGGLVMTSAMTENLVGRRLVADMRRTSENERPPQY